MHKRILSLTMLALSACGGGSNSGGQVGSTETGDAAANCVVEMRKTELDDALAIAPSEVDFSYTIERVDGRRYSYNRGASTLATSYESASTSKLIAAAVIMRLVQQGYLSLSDHPQDFISDWPIQAGDPLYSMTLAQLLGFTSGLNVEPLCLNMPNSDYGTCVKSIAASNQNNGITPGSQFYYASTHLQVAGWMATKARGLASWAEVFSEFKAQTGLFPGAAYDLPSPSNPRLAGGMHWSGDEYMAFLKALQSGSLLNAALMEEFLKDRTASPVSLVYSPAAALGEEWHYGSGFWHECQSASFNCSSAVRISSPGAYGAYPFWDRGKGYFGILARQGALGTFTNGVATERAVRAQAEAWAACR